MDASEVVGTDAFIAHDSCGDAFEVTLASPRGAVQYVPRKA